MTAIPFLNFNSSYRKSSSTKKKKRRCPADSITPLVLYIYLALMGFKRTLLAIPENDRLSKTADSDLDAIEFL